MTERTKRILAALTLTLGAMLASTGAAAYTIYTDRAAWEAAVEGIVVVDDFLTMSDIPPSRTIRFPSGVTSTRDGDPGEQLSAPFCGPNGNTATRPGNSVSTVEDINGGVIATCYAGFLDTGVGSDRTNLFITWKLPRETRAIGFERVNLDLLSDFGKRLSIEGDFDGSGSQKIVISSDGTAGGERPANLPFWGIVGEASFDEFRFVLTGDFNQANFNLDRALYAFIPPVAPPQAIPTLSQWSVITLGVMLGIVGFFALRRGTS